MLQAEENSRNADTLRKQLEVELRQVVVRLEQTEATALREGKKLAEKLQNRVSELERCLFTLSNPIQSNLFKSGNKAHTDTLHTTQYIQ